MLTMEKKKRIKPKIGRNVNLTSRFITSRSPPIPVKWIMVKLLHYCNDYKLPYADYERVLKQFSAKHVNEFSHYSKYFEIDFESNTVIFNREKLKLAGISIRQNKYKEVDVDFLLVADLLTAYNQARNIYLEKKKIHNRLPISAKPTTMYIYGNLIEFLQENQITDWYLFFYCLFAYHEWNMPWNLRTCATDKCLEMYSLMKDKCYNEIYGTASPEAVEALKRSRWIDIYDHIEKSKNKYLEKELPQLCMNNIDDTLGYHPLSEVCERCPLKENCKKGMYKYFQYASDSDLDIIKLRNQEVSIIEAKKRLKELGSEFDFYE